MEYETNILKLLVAEVEEDSKENVIEEAPSTSLVFFFFFLVKYVFSR